MGERHKNGEEKGTDSQRKRETETQREREDTDAERGDRHAKKREQNPTRGKETQRNRDLKTDGDQTGVGVPGQT